MSLLALGLVLGGLFYSTPLNSETQQNEQIQPVSTQMTGDLVQVNAKSVTRKGGTVSTRAKCSCSMLTDYLVHVQSWSNYCPQCNKRGTLIFEKTGDCPEGMVRCTRCDADFCAVHGKEHVYKGATYLREA